MDFQTWSQIDAKTDRIFHLTTCCRVNTKHCFLSLSLQESLATEMMTLVAKEGEFARNLLDVSMEYTCIQNLVVWYAPFSKFSNMPQSKT